jgi:hypoxanthine phosphoribosyltransferase
LGKIPEEAFFHIVFKKCTSVLPSLISIEKVNLKKKDFVSYEKVRENSLKLAYKIFQSGFIPDIIYVCLRGGAYMGNIISEFFKVLKKDSDPLLYAAVVARSYFNNENQGEVIVDGWTYDPSLLNGSEKILFVDDIFDTGYTINHLINLILKQNIPRESIKIAVHDYKKHAYLDEQLAIHPDYYCRYFSINSPEEDIWIHYLSHEMVGLTHEECEISFPSADPDIKSALTLLKEKLKP